MVTIKLDEADLLRLQVIVTDSDAEEALAFVRERLLPEINAQRGKTMLNHLDGGKGSMF
ncbi:MAG TPA: hypothetical protein VGL77_12485 [Armatimonadota bacterium]|jgi:hypothetical protein